MESGDPRADTDPCKDCMHVSRNSAFLHEDVLPCRAFFTGDGRDARHGSSEGWRDSGLHADLDSFEWTKANIGDEFGRGRGSKVEQGLVLSSILFTNDAGVGMLEVLVEAVLACTLNRIPDEGWTPTSEDTADAFSTTNLAPGLEVALVQVGIDLSSAFDKIKGCDCCMSCALAR